MKFLILGQVVEITVNKRPYLPHTRSSLRRWGKRYFKHYMTKKQNNPTKNRFGASSMKVPLIREYRSSFFYEGEHGETHCAISLLEAKETVESWFGHDCSKPFQKMEKKINKEFWKNEESMDD